METVAHITRFGQQIADVLENIQHPMSKYYLTPYYIVLWGSFGGKLRGNLLALEARIGLTSASP